MHKIAVMNFYELIKNIHGYLAILACFLLVVLAIMTLIYFINKKQYNTFYKKIGLYTLITFHSQLLLGIVMLFINIDTLSNLSYKIQGKMSLMEHIPANFTAVLLITVFYAMAKRSKKVGLVMFLLVVIALILMARTFILLQGVLA